MSFPIVQFVVSGLLIWGIAGLVTGGWRRHKRVDELQCGACGYPIAGLTRPQCPECGGALNLATIATPADPRPTRWRFALNVVGWFFASALVSMVVMGIASAVLGERIVQRDGILYGNGLNVVITAEGGRAYDEGTRLARGLRVRIDGVGDPVSRELTPSPVPRDHERDVRAMLVAAGTSQADNDLVVADIATLAAHLSGNDLRDGVAASLNAQPTPSVLGSGGGGYTSMPGASPWFMPAATGLWVVLVVVGEYFIWRDYARRRVAAAKADAEIARVMSGWADA